MASRTIKQVIILRTDLNMRKGKMVAQGSHASMAFLTKEAWFNFGEEFRNNKLKNPLEIKEWMTDGFTKVCLQVGSEAELEDIYNKAIEAGLNAHLIIDSGFTEFKGVPTKTAVAIGPNKNEEINLITEKLKLL